MWNICRTCLTKNVEMISIFDLAKSPSIYDMIMAISSLEVLPNDTLPSEICITCFETLEMTYYFKEQVIKCNNVLQNQTQSSTLLARHQVFSVQQVKEEKDVKSFPAENSSDIDYDNCNLEEECAKNEEIVVEENDMQLEDNLEMRPKQIIVCNEADAFCADDDIPLKLLLVNKGNHDKSQNTRQNRIADGEVTGKVSKRRFRCQYCNTSFKFASNLRRHSRHHTDEATPKPYKCKFCGKAFEKSSFLKRHLPAHADARPFECDHCYASFKNSHNLYRHTRQHTHQHKCEVCEEKFAFASTLKLHMRGHTGEKPYKCHHCDARFTQAGNRNVHMRTLHTGSHKCDMCSLTFEAASHLKLHKRSHGSSFKCHICNVPFSSKGNLTKHTQRLHTAETRPKRHTCDVCGDAFEMRSHFEIHLRKHTGEKPYECQHCYTRFARTSALGEHMRRKHPDEDMAKHV